MNIRTSFFLRLFLSALLAAVAGCQTVREREQAAIDSIDRAMREAMAAKPVEPAGVPAEVTAALLPSLDMPDAGSDGTGLEQRFDISVNNVPADQFFMSLVEDTSYNMVVHPEVSGVISLTLKDVTIPDVMQAVRDVYGYEFVATDYGFQVLPSRLQARIYQINYLNVRRTGRSQTFVSSGSLTESTEENGTATSSTDPNSTNIGNSTATLFGTEIQTEQPENNFWEELRASILAIIGSAQGRSVVVNPHSGVVVVRALPNELREVDAFLKATQVVVARQVILEAKILEVELDDGFQSGINWGALLTSGSNRSATIGHIGGGSVLVNESGTSDIAGALGDVSPALPLALPGTATSAFGGVFTLALALNDFNAFVELLKTQGTVHVLSSPRISTMNNQKAVIKVGTDEFFVTDIANTTTTGTLTTVTPRVTLTPFFSGIALDVTPQISADGEVVLHVHPTISSVVDQQKTVTLGTLVQELPLALSTVRETDSIVRAKNGQVVVIGGLMQERADTQRAATPGLSDIPVIGEAFRHTRQTARKSELVILLRPTVIDSEDQWADAVRASGQRISNLREFTKTKK